MRTKSGIAKVAFSAVVLASLLMLGAVPGFAREKMRPSTPPPGAPAHNWEEISGSPSLSTSTPRRQTKHILVEAFQKGQNQGLVNALEKMKAVGHISITGTLGYDLSFIKLIDTPTGRTIRFATNRPIHFGEAYYDTQSQYYNLTAGEINLNDQDKSKSNGVLYPAAQLTIGSDGQFTLELNKNPWRLGNIIDWAGTPGEN